MPTIEEPLGIEGAAARVEREERARVRGERPVPVLVLGLERGADDAGRRGVDEHVERPELGDLLGDAGRGDVSAHEDRLGAERAQLRRRSPPPGRRRACSRSPRVSRRATAKRSAIAFPMPRDPPVTRTEAPVERHSAFGSGSYAGAEDGIGLPADPARAARARRSRRATTRARDGRGAPSSPRRTRRTGWSSGRSSMSSRMRARSW